MSYDYTLAGWLPPGAGPPMAYVSTAVGEPVDVDTDPEVPRIWVDGLSVSDNGLDDDERRETAGRLGLDVNFSLFLSDYSRGDPDMEVRVVRRLLAVAGAFAAVAGFRGALFVELDDETYLARIENGIVVLNSGYWNGRRDTGTVLAAFPEPFAMEELRMRA